MTQRPPANSVPQVKSRGTYISVGSGEDNNQRSLGKSLINKHYISGAEMATSESSDEGYTVSRTRSSVTVHAPPPNSGPAVTSTGTPIPKTVAADADVVEQSIAASDELAPSNSTLQAPDPKTQSKLCGVCLENESKYKCARCLVP